MSSGAIKSLNIVDANLTFLNTLWAAHFWLAPIIKITVSLALVIFVQLTLRPFLQRLTIRLKPGSHRWYIELLSLLRLPLVALIWLLFVTYTLDTVAAATAPLTEFSTPVNLVCNLSIIGIFLYTAFIFIDRIEILSISKRSVRNRNSISLIRVMARLAKIGAGLIGLLCILSRLGISVASIAVIGGAGTAGIAFAANGLLSNFFGGLLLYMNRAFMVGEVIRSPDRAIEGTVENIGWFMTHIRDPNNRLLYVPNSIFIGIIVVNVSRFTQLRVTTEIAIQYKDAQKIASIMSALNHMAHTHPELDPLAGITVYVNKLTESSLNITFNAFTKMTIDLGKFPATQQDVLLKIDALLAQHGVARSSLLQILKN